MGKKSVSKDKTYYQIVREELGYSRDKASELMNGVSPEHIERIENGKMQITPADVRAMYHAYGDAEICNYYCAHDCDLGFGIVASVEGKEVAQIALETHNILNRLGREKDRLMEILEDGRISEEEYEDFRRIREEMLRMSGIIDSLELWIEKQVKAGVIPEDLVK